MGCIYGYQNNINQKWYVGYTNRDIVIRDKEHRSGRENNVLFKAFCKYGYDSFSLRILEDGIIPEFLPEREKYWVAKFNAYHDGYNLTEGGNGSYGHSVETIKEIAEAGKGRKHAPETRRKISQSKMGEKNPQFGKPAWNRGKSTSEETRRKQSEARKGKKRKPHSPQTIKKISESNKGLKRSEQARQNMSDAQKGKTPWIKGKKHSKETCKKMSESAKGRTPWNKSPHYEPAKNLFFALSGLTLRQRRKQLQNKYQGILNKSTIQEWTCDWSDSPPSLYSDEYDQAHEIFLSLPPDMDLKEKRKFLRDKFSEVNEDTIRRWTRKWQKELTGETIPARGPSHPERPAVHEHFLSLPSDMDLKDKRLRLYAEFPSVKKPTVRKWTLNWQSDT